MTITSSLTWRTTARSCEMNRYVTAVSSRMRAVGMSSRTCWKAQRFPGGSCQWSSVTRRSEPNGGAPAIRPATSATSPGATRADPVTGCGQAVGAADGRFHRNTQERPQGLAHDRLGVKARIEGLIVDEVVAER